jgi:hypothetical protein
VQHAALLSGADFEMVKAPPLASFVCTPSSCAANLHLPTAHHPCLQGISPRKSWHSCHRCRYGHVVRSKCAERNRGGGKVPFFQPCENAMRGRGRDDAAFSVLAIGNYAAQIAWWLQFFPADRFIIVSAAQLRDPVARLQARLQSPNLPHSFRVVCASVDVHNLPS